MLSIHTCTAELARRPLASSSVCFEEVGLQDQGSAGAPATINPRSLSSFMAAAGGSSTSGTGKLYLAMLQLDAGQLLLHRASSPSKGKWKSFRLADLESLGPCLGPRGEKALLGFKVLRATPARDALAAGAPSAGPSSSLILEFRSVEEAASFDAWVRAAKALGPALGRVFALLDRKRRGRVGVGDLLQGAQAAQAAQAELAKSACPIQCAELKLSKDEARMMVDFAARPGEDFLGQDLGEVGRSFDLARFATERCFKA